MLLNGPDVNKAPNNVDLHPTEWDENWQPPIGNDLLPGEKPHIWQEFKRDQHMMRREGDRFWGRRWGVLPLILIAIAAMTYVDAAGGPAWLLAIRHIF